MHFNDIQANILKPHGRRHTAFIFFRFNKHANRELVVEFMGHLGQLVTSHAAQINDTRAHKAAIKRKKYDHRSIVVITAGFSASGLKKLKTNSGNLPGDVAFWHGMKERKYRLNDYMVKRDKEYRGSGLKHSGISGFISIAHDESGQVEAEVVRIEKTDWFVRATARAHVHKEYGFRGKTLPGGENGAVGPLGFVDGVSEKRSYEEAGRIALVSEYNHVIDKSAKGPLVYPAGSYLAFRKIRVNSAVFDRMIDKLAKRLVVPEGEKPRELAAAMFMGRFRDGSPLVTADRPASTVNELHALNSTPFDYRNDRSGNRCPFHAHVRVMNARAGGPQAAQIIRRGVNYGADPQSPEGLLFVSYQASIVDQFEPLFDLMEEDSQRDLIAYNGSERSLQAYPVYPGSNKRTRKLSFSGRKLTTFLGGEYFYVPSIRFLKRKSW